MIIGSFGKKKHPKSYRTMEVGIEPTVRHATDLRYIPVIVTDACGAGDEDAARRSIASLEFAGDSLMTNVETICSIFRRMESVA